MLRWEAIQDPLSEAALQGVGETGVEFYLYIYYVSLLMSCDRIGSGVGRGRSTEEAHRGDLWS